MAPPQDHRELAESPLSHTLKVEAIGPAGLTVAIEATEPERAAIAALLDLKALARLSAQLTVVAEGARVRVRGLIEADATQACIVTLEPVEAQLREAVEWVYAPAAEAEAAMRAAGFDPDSEDMAVPEIGGIDVALLNNPDALPDPIVDGVIDLGQAVYEEFAVALDPYPRKPGAVFEPPPEPAGFSSPFGALAAFAPKPDKPKT